MNNTTRRAATVVGTVAAATALAAMSPPAQSASLANSRVTVQTTDSTPASGQTFRLFGAVRSEGVRVPATIRVKTFRKGAWVQLQGAVMETNRFDRYKIRIVLQMKGERLLRVIGDPQAEGIKTARKTITVSVH